MTRRAISLALATAALLPGDTPAAELPGYEQQVLPYFQAYCLRCHDAKTHKGGFRLDALPREFVDQATAQRWGELLFRVNAREMPPKKEPQPKTGEIAAVVDWLSARLKEGEAVRMTAREPVAHYRLSREEYGHTVYDLLGVCFDVTLPGALNEDPRWHGFERLGSLLSLSPAFVGQLATYALRRVMTVDDAIKSIAAAARQDGHGLRTIVECLVLSDLFRKR